MARQNSGSTGVGVLGVTQIVLIILKLTGLIMWPWWIILIPLWVSLGLMVLAVIVLIALMSYLKGNNE